MAGAATQRVESETGAPIFTTVRELHRLSALQANRCFLCGSILTAANVDHVIPRRVREARSKPWNRAATHARCNTEKGDRLPTITELEKLSRLHGVRLGRIMRMAYADASEAEVSACLWIPGPSELERVHG